MTIIKLPDILAPGLRIVFVGTAAGRKSAAVGAYYAHSGNKFWRTLHEVGFTPRRLRPEEFRELPAFGVGLTDLCKTEAGMDHQIPASGYDIDGFDARIRKFAPAAIAFTSKQAASLWTRLRTSKITYGRQTPALAGFPDVFVLPSPSGAASRYWTLGPWHELRQSASLPGPPR